jgi:hypothetical protein
MVGCVFVLAFFNWIPASNVVGFRPTAAESSGFILWEAFLKREVLHVVLPGNRFAGAEV